MQALFIKPVNAIKNRTKKQLMDLSISDLQIYQKHVNPYIKSVKSVVINIGSVKGQTF